MEKVSASSKILIKSSMETSIMVNLKVMASYILLLEIIMLDSSDLTKKKAEVYTHGLEKKVMFMKVNLKEAKEMVKGLFGGQMAVGTKVNSEMEFSQDGEYFIAKEVIESTKVTGITECLMAKELNISRMVSVMKVPSNKTNSTVMVYSTKMTR